MPQKPDEWVFRALPVSRESLDDENLSFDIIAATEQPVLEPDFERNEMVYGVLLMSGAEMPASGQVPLLDSHRRDSSENLLGSVRNLRVDGDRLPGRATFSSIAQDQYRKVKEGHLTDLSVGAKPLAKTYIPRGQSKVIGGKKYTGPMNVFTRWKLREISVTPIGADDQAKVRGLTEIPSFLTEGFSMNEQLRAACLEAGMPADATDEQAQTWLTENVRKLTEIPSKPAKNDDVSRTDGTLTPEKVQELIARAIADREEAKRAESDKLRKSIKDACERKGLMDYYDELCRTSTSFEDALERMVDLKANTKIAGSRFIAGPSEHDKHTEAVRHGLLSRALGAEFDVPADKRAAGWGDYQYASLNDIAREFCEMDGYNPRGLTKDEVAKVALGFGDQIGIRRSASYGYHTQGMFPQLLADVANKSMLRGYMEATPTWSRCFRQAPSVSDFKSVKRIRLSDAPNLEAWPGIASPNEIGLTDEQESYAVECYSNKVSITYKTIVNDDLGAFSRIPQLLGSAAARTVNAIAWAPITSNQTMNDSVALFAVATGARKKDNYTASSGGVPSVSQIATGRKLMRLQVGANDPEGNASNAILNLSPRYLVVPAALETTADQLVSSIADPAASHTGTTNPFRSLEVICEPILDANSSQAWYLFASPSQIDTVEVTFLQGQETPEIRQQTDFETLAQKIIVLQTVAAKAIDWRGMYKNAGS